MDEENKQQQPCTTSRVAAGAARLDFQNAEMSSTTCCVDAACAAQHNCVRRPAHSRTCLAAALMLDSVIADWPFRDLSLSEFD